MMDPRIRKKLRHAQGGNCCYCGKKMVRHTHIEGKALSHNVETIEHLIRKIEGGRNVPDNLALSCYECNSGRGSIDWFTYKSYRMKELWS